VTPLTKWYIPFRHNWEPDVTRKPTDLVQLKLRFDERLRRRIDRAAKHNECSMNAEIIKRLEQSFEQVDEIEEIEKIFGGADNFERFKMLARAIGLVEAKAGARWTDRILSKNAAKSLRLLPMCSPEKCPVFTRSTLQG
jgi:hypothetical protein